MVSTDNAIIQVSDLIKQHLDNPHQLERVYRQQPEAFKQALATLWPLHTDSQVLAVWYERLYFQESKHSNKAFFLSKDFLVMGILAILAGLITRILFHFVEGNNIAPINLVFGIVTMIATYFIYKNPPHRKMIYILASWYLFFVIYINVFPFEQPSDAMIMAYLHLPIMLWFLVGLAYTGNQYRSRFARLAYLQWNSELLLLYAMMAISGIILTILTITLFQFIGLEIEEFYFSNVVLFGAAGLLIVATYLIMNNFNLTRQIVPYLANLFSPLVLITLIVYLITVVWVGRNPFVDRDFLIWFNGILLVVLALTLFSITESKNHATKSITVYINFALISLVLIMDTIALSAIIFRLSAYGITPNRIAVLGANILIFVNLIWMFKAYLRFLMNKANASAMEDAVTCYLPIYGGWALLVTLIFPLIF